MFSWIRRAMAALRELEAGKRAQLQAAAAAPLLVVELVLRLEADKAARMRQAAAQERSSRLLRWRQAKLNRVRPGRRTLLGR